MSLPRRFSTTIAASFLPFLGKDGWKIVSNFSVNFLKYRSTSEGGEGFLGGGEEAGGEDPTNQVQNKATPRRGGHPTPGGEFKLENRCHLTKKYSCCSHGRGQHCLQPSIPGVDNVFDVVGADRSDHSHPHAHHDSPNHDHDEMGSVSKEKIGGE